MPGLREDLASRRRRSTSRRAAGRAPNLLAMLLFEKFGQHQPLNRQASAMPARACHSPCRRWPTRSAPVARSWSRCHGASRRTCLPPSDCMATTRRCRSSPRARPSPGVAGSTCATIAPFGGTRLPPAAMFYYSRDRRGEHVEEHLRPMVRPTSPRCPSARQPNPGGRSTYQRGFAVQTTGTTSDHSAVAHLALGSIYISGRVM